MRVLGLDPGLQATGWGVIECEGSFLRHLDHGVVKTKPNDALGRRLVFLFDALQDILTQFRPDEAAVEKIFVNKNPISTLKLGYARALSLLVPAQQSLEVFEYAPNLIKKAVIGSGHGTKTQVQMMVKVLLSGVALRSVDGADALAVAICHVHHQQRTTLIDRQIFAS